MTNLPTLSVPPDLVDLYRSLVIRSPGEGLDALSQAAAALGRRAFVDEERPAWEVVQVLLWRLQRRSSARPTCPGDVVVLDALYRCEEQTLPWETPPEGLAPGDFCGFLEREMAKFSSSDGMLMQAVVAGVLTDEDWKFLGYQWLPTAIEFTRTIALASLPLPTEQARLLYANLWDEAGRGDPAEGHFHKLRLFLEPFGVAMEDEAALLDWATPESIALANTELRLLWHPEPGWGLGSLYLAEKLIPSELGRIREAAMRMRLGSDAMAFLDEHVVLDVEHADDWLAVIGALLIDRRAQEITFNAAVQRGKAQKKAWDTALPAYMQWKQTQVTSRLPARELSAAVDGADL